MAESDKAVVSSTADFSSDSTVSDEWQELTKSDYAKVIFSDILCNAASGTVECKFQITDNVHEDPNDYVGLFRIGYEDLSQCLVSKMLSQTTCEDDGKLQRCVFTFNELPFPYLDDGFYQFLYVTRDQEVCGASMPFQIKISTLKPKKNSVDSSASENSDGGFLLVSNEIEIKEKEESNKHEKVSLTQNSLSEQKKEEIADWISKNPDYFSLNEQIKEHTFTIEALQQSKDLAMKEVSHLYGILNTQNDELIQLKNMLAAYEEKIKISYYLLEEKNEYVAQMKKLLAFKNEDRGLLEKKAEELAQLKKEFSLQEEKLKASFAYQIQQGIEINNLKKELEEIKKQKAKECRQVTAETGNSVETVIQKMKDMVQTVSSTIKNIDFTDENEVENFFQLKIQVLIISSKMQRATNKANMCDRNGLHKTLHSIIEKKVKGDSCDGSITCALDNRDPVMATNTSAPQEKKSDFPISPTVETSPLPDLREKETTNDDVSEAAEEISFNDTFESEGLKHQINDLPKLDIINKSTANMLLADGLVDAEDVAVINRLTHKMNLKYYNLYDVEIVEDSSSDSESDPSEFSDYSSFVKVFFSVDKIMKALSSISNQTILEQLVKIKNEDDKHLIHKNGWNVLLQKCALHYGIEILFEHIEKQQEGTKKVSEKICDLLTKCMVLKDEVSDSKARCEKLQSIVDKKDRDISRFKNDLKFKNSLFMHICSQKEALECKGQLAEKTIEDLHARIMEASNLYKQQYTEIERLSKKLRKYKLGKNKTKCDKCESSIFSSASSKTTSSFEVVEKESVQNINDSDTGEHMFEKVAFIPIEKIQEDKDSNIGLEAVTESNVSPLVFPFNAPEAGCLAHKGIQTQISLNKELKAVAENSPCTSPFDDLQPSISNSGNLTAHITGDKANAETDEYLSQRASLFSALSYEHFQGVIKDIFADNKKPKTSRNSEKNDICCYVCKEVFSLSPETSGMDLMNHLENEHLMKMCPVCGQLFEDAIPQKYFHIHVEKHFENE